MVDVSDQSVTEDSQSPDSSPIALCGREWQGCLLSLGERSPSSALISPLLWRRTDGVSQPPQIISVSAGCPSSMRPCISREAALTWKCAVAV